MKIFQRTYGTLVLHHYIWYIQRKPVILMLIARTKLIDPGKMNRRNVRMAWTNCLSSRLGANELSLYYVNCPFQHHTNLQHTSLIILLRLQQNVCFSVNVLLLVRPKYRQLYYLQTIQNSCNKITPLSRQDTRHPFAQNNSLPRIYGLCRLDWT